MTAEQPASTLWQWRNERFEPGVQNLGERGPLANTKKVKK